MLNRAKTRFAPNGGTYNGKLLSTLSGSSLPVDGTPLIAVREGSEGVLRPSTGAADTVFAGFAYYDEQIAQTNRTVIETVTAVGTTATLSRAPTAGTDMLVVKGSTALTYSAGAPAAGAFQLSGPQIITLNAAEANSVLTVSYKTAMTVNEAAIYNGTMMPWVGGANYLVGVVTGIEIFTDQYDSTVDWNAIDLETANEKLKAGANGLVTAGSANGALINGYVIAVPTADSPFLGIRMR